MTYQNQSDERGTGSAVTELLALGAVAVVAMALLTFGYRSNVSGMQSAGTATPTSTSGAGAPADASNRMTTPPLNRANPADTPAAPTTSPAGTGSESGGQPTKSN